MVASSGQLLSLNSLSIRFGGVTAARDITFAIEQDTIAAIIGPNGAGKTTVFNCVSGVYTPSAGTISLNGDDLRGQLSGGVILRACIVALLCGLLLTLGVNIQTIWQAAIVDQYVYAQPFPWPSLLPTALQSFLSIDPWYTAVPMLLGNLLGFGGYLTTWSRARHSTINSSRKGIARTFQNIRLFKEMTAFDNVLVGAAKYLPKSVFSALWPSNKQRNDIAKSRKLAVELLKFVGLEDYSDTKADVLPYGLQRRLEIARALASNPKLLLLDEPAAGMNPAEMEALGTLISEIKTKGTTVLLIEHHMKLVMAISQQITVLNYGETIAHGTPAHVQQHPQVIAAYLGEDEHE